VCTQNKFPTSTGKYLLSTGKFLLSADEYSLRTHISIGKYLRKYSSSTYKYLRKHSLSTYKHSYKHSLNVIDTYRNSKLESLHCSNGKLSVLVPSPPQTASSFLKDFPIELVVLQPPNPQLDTKFSSQILHQDEKKVSASTSLSNPKKL
jgi:hypothetical protein